MKWISSVIIFSFAFGLVAKTTMSYRERKKQLDGKITLVLDIKEQLKLEPETGKTSVETIRSQVEETVPRGQPSGNRKNTFCLRRGTPSYTKKTLFPYGRIGKWTLPKSYG